MRIIDVNRGSRINKIPNTFIGGVGEHLNTPQKIANNLRIDVRYIGYVGVSGKDVEVAINTDYDLRSWISWNSNNGVITYFKDINGRCKNIPHDYPFYGASSLKLVYFPAIVDKLGSTHLKNEIFNQTPASLKVYVPPQFETINGGEEEGDLAYHRSKGGHISYIENFIKPSSITDLTYNSADTTLNFTPPASVNALDFYEVYVNGFYNSEITGSGAAVFGLMAGDKVNVYACDIYYNRSISNEITI